MLFSASACWRETIGHINCCLPRLNIDLSPFFYPCLLMKEYTLTNNTVERDMSSRLVRHSFSESLCSDPQTPCKKGLRAAIFGKVCWSNDQRGVWVFIHQLACCMIFILIAWRKLFSSIHTFSSSEGENNTLFGENCFPAKKQVWESLYTDCFSVLCRII